MSSILASSAIAMLVSAGTVVGLGASGILPNIIDDKPQTAGSVFDDEELSADELVGQIEDLQSDLESTPTTTHLDELRDDIENLLETRINELEKSAVGKTVVIPNTGASEGSENSSPGISMEELENLIVQILDERAKEQSEKNKAKAKENRQKKVSQDREIYLKKTTELFRKHQEKYGYSEYQVSEGIRIVMEGYDSLVIYEEDVRKRKTEEHQEVSSEEIVSEKKRIKSDTDTKLKLLFAQGQQKEIDELMKRIPRKSYGSPRNQPNTHRGSHGKKPGGGGDGGARR